MLSVAFSYVLFERFIAMKEVNTYQHTVVSIHDARVTLLDKNCYKVVWG